MKFLKLDIGYSVNATPEKSTFGYWSFADVQGIVIRNCNNFINTDSFDSIDQDPITSLIFYNSSGLIENLTIKDLNFNHIHDGLIVDYYSNIQIINSIIINNTVNYGVITVLNFGTLIMLDCVVQRNQGKYVAGGILAKEGVVYLTNTYFNDNKAVERGGAIYGIENSFFSIQNCTFHNNQVTLDNEMKNLLRNGYGGAIYLVENSQTEMQHVYFIKNKAIHGSGIYISSLSKLSCKSCLFYQNIIHNNKSNAAAIQIQNHSILNITALNCMYQISKFSSCIYASDYCNVFLHDSIVSMNTGTVISLENDTSLFTLKSLFSNNSTPTNGGASWLELSTASLNNCSFHDNLNTAVIIFNYTRVSIFNCTFQNNSSPKNSRAIFVTENCNLNVSNTIFLQNSGTLGGAVYADHSFLLMLDCIFVGNTALMQMNNLDPNEIKTGAGEAILVLSSEMKIYQSGFSNNYAPFHGGSLFSFESSLLINGSVFENNIAAFWGGALSVSNGSFLTIEESYFKNNSVFEDRTISQEIQIFSDDLVTGGGVILIFGSALNIHQSNFSNNYADKTGGSIVSSESLLYINGSVFENNVAGVTGGSIIGLYQSSVIIEYSSFINNNVQDNVQGKEINYSKGGGAIAIAKSCEFKIYQSIFSNNTAPFHRGSLFSSESSLLINGSVFENNIAGFWGGAIAGVNNHLLTIQESYFINNSVLVDNTTVEAETLYNNAGTAGGGVFIFRSDLSICQSLFSNNYAYYQGGSLFAMESSIYINDSIFQNNSADILGGAISMGNYTILTIRNSSLMENTA